MDSLETQLGNAAQQRGITVDELTAALHPHIHLAADEAAARADVAPYLAKVRAATQAKTASEASWRAAIVEASLLGRARRDDVADAAGITRQWVSHLVKTQEVQA